jgi:hypothetical protein
MPTKAIAGNTGREAVVSKFRSSLGSLMHMIDLPGPIEITLAILPKGKWVSTKVTMAICFQKNLS